MGGESPPAKILLDIIGIVRFITNEGANSRSGKGRRNEPFFIDIQPEYNDRRASNAARLRLFLRG